MSFANSLNELAAALLKRIVGAEPIRVTYANGVIQIALNDLGGKRIPALTFAARLVEEIGGGVYRWAPFAVGPGQAEVNISDQCEEYNGSTGIQVGALGTGTIVRLFKDQKIGEATPRWFFFFPVAACSSEE